MTKWTHISVFWKYFHIQLIKCRNFCEQIFFIGSQQQVVTKWLNFWPNEHINCMTNLRIRDQFDYFWRPFWWLLLELLLLHFPAILKVFFAKLQIAIKSSFLFTYYPNFGFVNGIYSYICFIRQDLSQIYGCNLNFLVCEWDLEKSLF